jgi:hypothetical protein
MGRFTRVVIAAAALAGATDALAQRWSSVPSRGACFYEDADYRGSYFCFPVGEDVGSIPAEANDRISSIRVFGRVEVTVYKDGSFRGPSHRFTSNMSNLATAGWNDRVSSFRISERSTENSWGGGGGYGGGGWGGGHSNSGYGGGYGGGFGGAYGGGAHGGWGDEEGGSRWSYQQAEQIVRRAYRTVLGRDPDPAARPWINEVMKNNWTQARFEAELRKSEEYRNKRF